MDEERAIVRSDSDPAVDSVVHTGTDIGDGFSERALYVVDGDGVIRYSHVSPFVHHIPDIYELFTVLDSLKTEVPAPGEVTR